MCLKLNCSLLLLQSRAKSQLFEFATHRGRSHQIGGRLKKATYLLKCVGLESKTLHDLGAPIEDLILLASDGPPRIKEFRAVSEHFSFPDLAADERHIFTVDKIVFRSSASLISDCL